MTDVAELLAELVAIDSVSARSNRPMVEALAPRLSRLGFDIRLLPYSDDAGVEKVNLVASAGPSARGQDGLCFVGHTDTVPYDADWKDALRLVKQGENLVARGAADTKGFIASVLCALERADLTALKRPLLCLFTADEEVGCVGAKKLEEMGAARPSQAIVGEPTRLIPVRSHKGYSLAYIEVLGKEGHSAYPHLGRSAILDAGELLVQIRAAAMELEKDRDAHFDPPFTTINVGTIEGGKAKNVIPGRCAFPVEWRPIPGQGEDVVPALLRRAIEKSGADARLTVTRGDPAVSTAPDAPIVRFLEQETGERSIAIPFGTELPQITALGAQGCVCGPGDIKVAHRTGEFVPRADLDRAVEIYRKAVAKFCSR